MLRRSGSRCPQQRTRSTESPKWTAAFVLVTNAAKPLRSLPNTSRPARRASTTVVPPPTNGSTTKPPGSEKASIAARARVVPTLSRLGARRRQRTDEQEPCDASTVSQKPRSMAAPFAAEKAPEAIQSRGAGVALFGGESPITLPLWALRRRHDPPD